MQIIKWFKNYWRKKTIRGPWCENWGILEEEFTDILVGGGYHENTTKEDYKKISL